MKNQGQQFAEKHEILLELSKVAYSDAREIFHRITETTSALLNVERVSIWFYNEIQTEIRCQDLYLRSEKKHNSGDRLSTLDFPRYFKALRESLFISADDVSRDPRTNEFDEIYHNPLHIKSMLDVPVRIEGHLNAILCCEHTETRREWKSEEQDFVTSMAEIISLAIQTSNRRKAQAELRKSEEKYRKIVDNAVIGVYRSNIAGQFLFLNQTMVEIFEFDSIANGMLFNIEKLYKSLKDRKEFVTRLIQERFVRNYEIELKTAKGNSRQVLVNAFYEDENILGMVLDITERKRSEEALQKARIEAEESDRLKTSLLANMSHEFRTPMNAILGFSDLIARESQDPEMVFYARKIHNSGNRLMTTLKAILDLADIEATRTKIKFIDINIQRIITSALHPFYPAANEKRLYLITEFKDSLMALSDENLVHMILHNLIDNAVKFTNTGGVTIETNIGVQDGKEWVQIHVKDTGIGVSREHFETIFHEFRQVSEGYNRSYEGTGLGLSLARKMAEINGGKITLESEPGLGSIFTLWLPASVKTSVKTPIDEHVIPDDSPVKTFHLKKPQELPLVLVVEDNDDNAEIIELYLKGRYITERASDARMAIKMASECQFACILMDINLGRGMDGLKATSEIRKLDSYAHIPIVAITGYTMSGDKEKLLNGGCSHYLGKPFSQQGLQNLMVEIFTHQNN